jgi:hypothetical protein
MLIEFDNAQLTLDIATAEATLSYHKAYAASIHKVGDRDHIPVIA